MDVHLSSKRYGDPFIHFDSDNSSHTFIIELTGVHKKILEIGTSIGNVSKVLKERENSVTGIEIDSEAAEIAKKYCDHMIIGDVETIDLDKEIEPASFDVIVCGDVLEHLINPEDLLKKVKKYLKPEGFLVISIPNFCHGDVILNILKGDFKYTPMGLLDKTHLRFFGLKNIIELFTECGYQISNIHTTKLEIGNTELKIDMEAVPHELLEFLTSLPDSTTYQFIFTAHPSPAVGIPERNETDLDRLFSTAIAEKVRVMQLPILQELSVKNQELHELNNRVQSMVQSEIALNSRVQHLEKENSSIRRSIIWQFTMKFHRKIIEPVFPQTTRRRRYYDLCRSGGQILINEGVHSFRKHASQYLSQRKLHKSVKNTGSLKNSEDESDFTKYAVESFRFRPKISIITPVYNVDDKMLTECIESVLNQTYKNWEFCLVDDASEKKSIQKILIKYQNDDTRIKVKFNEKNLGISETTNSAIKITTGEFIAFLDNDDLLSKNALFEIVALLNEHSDADVIYSDQDKVTPSGEFYEPFYKPDWSPEYFKGVMYVGHLLTVRKSIAENAGLLDKTYDFVQDYEFMLRLSEKTNFIYHIPKILYHWRTVEGSIASNSNSKGNISEKQVQAVNSHLERSGLHARAISGPVPHRVLISPLPREQFPLVTIIIPTKDKPELIERCLKSIYGLTSYPNFEVIVMDNNTTDENAKNVINSFPCRKILYNEPFNFSKINNSGAKNANGDYLVFLNNDTQIQSRDWIESLLYYAEQSDVAAAGPLLVFPNNTVQHAGVVLGFRGTADHIMRDYSIDCDGYAGSLLCAREVSAITAACMMVKKSKFIEVGGFNEHYSIIYQDVDLCLKYMAKGYRIIFDPRAIITHYECSTRNKKSYDLVDRNLLLDQWEEVIKKGDKYYNCNFDLTHYGSGNTGYRTKKKME